MDKDKLHRALAHIAAGADKMAQAAQVIQEVYALGGASQDAAKALAEAALLAEDLPEPTVFSDTEELEWPMVDGYVSLDGGVIRAVYDECDEDDYLTRPAPDPCELRVTDTTKGRKLAYNILAACDLKDAQDEQTK